jgi:hypothetical protein
MLLSEYFDDYFYSLKQLSQHANITEEMLLDWQEQCLLPNAAYHIKNHLQSSSFFGLCDFIEEKEYYPRGYTKWIELLKRMDNPSSAQAYTLFYQNYAKAVTDLAQAGLQIPSDFFDELEERIQNQWQLFLAGKYGVITANGFIHEIVAIELTDYLFTANEMSDDKHYDEFKSQAIRLLERTLSFPPQKLNFTSQAHNTLEKLKSYE